jgi:hypothetical protein
MALLLRLHPDDNGSELREQHAAHSRSCAIVARRGPKSSMGGNDTVELSFDMGTQQLKANPAVVEDRGMIAFQRGPSFSA